MLSPLPVDGLCRISPPASSSLGFFHTLFFFLLFRGRYSRCPRYFSSLLQQRHFSKRAHCMAKVFCTASASLSPPQPEADRNARARRHRCGFLLFLLFSFLSKIGRVSRQQARAGGTVSGGAQPLMSFRCFFSVGRPSGLSLLPPMVFFRNSPSDRTE